jgi:beta-glucanase (GH16 family)
LVSTATVAKACFLDGKSNLVLRATHPAKGYFGGLVSGTWRGAIGTTWEARIKLNCLGPGMWPAWWLSNDDPGRSGEVDLMEWYGNGEWPSGTTVHANPEGTAFETHPIGVDGAWHNWRVTWNPSGCPSPASSQPVTYHHSLRNSGWAP